MGMRQDKFDLFCFLFVFEMNRFLDVLQGDSRRLVKPMRLGMLVLTARWFLVAFK